MENINLGNEVERFTMTEPAQIRKRRFIVYGIPALFYASFVIVPLVWNILFRVPFYAAADVYLLGSGLVFIGLSVAIYVYGIFRVKSAELIIYEKGFAFTHENKTKWVEFSEISSFDRNIIFQLFPIVHLIWIIREFLFPFLKHCRFK